MPNEKIQTAVIIPNAFHEKTLVQILKLITMKRYLLAGLATALIGFFFVPAASAQMRPGVNTGYNTRYENERYGNSNHSKWVNIARTRVSSGRNYEKVNINRRFGNVRQLLFNADGPVHIYRVTVRYSNGRTEELNVRNSRQNNRRSSRNSDLVVTVPNRWNNEVRQVTFWYDVNDRSRYRPTINVLGR